MLPLWTQYLGALLGVTYSFAKSKKQAMVALSTTEAEYIAGTDAAKELLWIRNFLECIGFPAQEITRVLSL